MSLFLFPNGVVPKYNIGGGVETTTPMLYILLLELQFADKEKRNICFEKFYNIVRLRVLKAI